MKLNPRKCLKLALTLAILLCGTNGYAQESESVQPPVDRAVWLDPFALPASWVDERINAPSPSDAEVISTGDQYAIVRMTDDMLHLVDASFTDLGMVSLPENAQWFMLDDKDRLFVHDGNRLWMAATSQDALKKDKFVSVLDVPNVRKMDIAGNQLVYADGENLSIVDLETGSVKRQKLSAYFDDEKVAAMTPEAVLEAETAASTKKKSKTTTKTKKKAEPEEAAEAAEQVADIQGIWWRKDGVGIVRMRSLINVRTFVTRDRGRSWSVLESAPETIVHSYGWIWDGNDRVLTADAGEWQKVCGTVMSPADHWFMSHAMTQNASVPEDWLHPALIPTEENASEEASCPRVSFIPTAKTSSSHDLAIRHDGIYGPDEPERGFLIGVYGTSQEAPRGWMIRPDSGVEPMSLPDSCRPRFVGSSRGLGVAMCESGEDKTQVIGYVRTEQSDWVAEAILPATVTQTPNLITADDGTLAIIGQCRDEIEKVPVMSEASVEAGSENVETEDRIVHVCYAAIRQPTEPGVSESWRFERIENADGFVPLSGGRIASVEKQWNNSHKLVLRSPQTTETLVESFDSSTYDGIVMTQEGCLALYDQNDQVNTPEVLKQAISDQVNPETGEVTPGAPVKLLSVEGRLSGMDCATSRSVAELGNQPEVIEQHLGEDRYGLRAGATSFFAGGDVITWAVRVEVLFPIYSGQYEVGLMYRLGGGNDSSSFGHTGMLSFRWRYDQLEKFDFAVGAGIGYGSLVGYSRKSDDKLTTEEDGTVSTTSGYKDCSNLSMRYMITVIAAYKFSERWKLYISADLIGGTSWGFDLGGGLEVRF